MVIGDKLKELREAKKLSQGDIEKRTGLLRCYISRVENGHTVPSVDTLEVSFSKVEPTRRTKHDSKLRPLVKALSRLTDKDQRLLLHMASKMANRG